MSMLQSSTRLLDWRKSVSNISWLFALTSFPVSADPQHHTLQHFGTTPAIAALPLLSWTFVRYAKGEGTLRMWLTFKINKKTTRNNRSHCDSQALVHCHLFMHQGKSLTWHVESRYVLYTLSSVCICFVYSGSDSIFKETLSPPLLKLKKVQVWSHFLHGMQTRIVLNTSVGRRDQSGSVSWTPKVSKQLAW